MILACRQRTQHASDPWRWKAATATAANYGYTLDDLPATAACSSQSIWPTHFLYSAPVTPDL